jgi:hypothetical protein
MVAPTGSFETRRTRVTKAEHRQAASYNDLMAAEPPHVDDSNLDAIVDRLRREVETTRSEGLDGTPGELRARRELDRLWAVTVDRPYLYRPGRWGRVRGAALVPLKAVVRRLTRWYVEPLATDQRGFNAAMLRFADELVERLVRLERSMSSLEERLARLERTADEAPSRGK